MPNEGACYSVPRIRCLGVLFFALSRRLVAMNSSGLWVMTPQGQGRHDREASA